MVYKIYINKAVKCEKKIILRDKGLRKSKQKQIEKKWGKTLTNIYIYVHTHTHLEQTK